MIRFAQVFAEAEIVSALRTQLNWTHFRILIAIDDPLKRDFYTEMCRLDRWSTRTLQSRIDSMLYECTALSKKPDEQNLIKANKASYSTLVQILSYMASIKNELKVHAVKGIIVAEEFDKKLRLAVTQVDNVKLVKYKAKFDFEQVE